MIPTELVEANKLYEEYKLDLALQSLNKLSPEKLEGYPIEIQLHFHTFKGKIHAILENYGDALILAEKSNKIASKFEKFNNSIGIIDSNLLFAEMLMRNGKYDKSYEILKEVNKIINKLPDKLDKLRKERKAESLSIENWLENKTGWTDRIEKIFDELHDIYSELGDINNIARIFSYRAWYFLLISGDNDRALKNLNKSNEIFSKMDVSPFFGFIECDNLQGYGVISFQRGDLIESIKYFSEALDIAEKNKFLSHISTSLINLGKIYLELADWDTSILYFNKTRKLAEKRQDVIYIINVLYGLFEANLYKGDIKIAEYHLEQIKKLNDQKKNIKINTMYRLCEGLFLRKSKRTRDLGKAQQILKDISEEEIFRVEFNIKAMVNLCEMLVLEFKESKDPDVLNELNQIINKLVKLAEAQKSYSVMAEALLLKAKIAIISLSLTEARQLTNHAQIIAEKHGLKNLAIKISIENDELIENLAVFNKMKLENEPIEQRLDKINLEKQLNEMLHKNKFEIPELEDEIPVAIMVMTDTGIPLFKRVFKEEWNVNEQFFSGFLSAFNKFSDQIFKNGFDRAVFGEYSIFMNSIENFMVTYIFLGQSYLAKQRFSILTEEIQNSKVILEKMKSSKYTGLVIYRKNFPELEALIQKIFVRKS